MWARVTVQGRRIRLTPNMTEVMLNALDHPVYPASLQHRRTFEALQSHGLLTPVGYERWALTGKGWKIATQLSERTNK